MFKSLRLRSFLAASRKKTRQGSWRISHTQRSTLYQLKVSAYLSSVWRAETLLELRKKAASARPNGKRLISCSLNWKPVPPTIIRIQLSTQPRPSITIQRPMMVTWLGVSWSRQMKLGRSWWSTTKQQSRALSLSMERPYRLCSPTSASLPQHSPLLTHSDRAISSVRTNFEHIKILNFRKK